MLATTTPARVASLAPAALPAAPASLVGRRRVVRRRRLVMRVRDWLGIGVIACFSVTLFAVTFFSLVGR